MAAPTSNGQPDSFFIAEVRRILRDQLIFLNDAPQSDGSSGGLGVAGSKPIRLQRSPVGRSFITLTAPAPNPSANAPGFVSWAPHFDTPPPDSQLYAFRPVLSDAGAVGTFAAGTYQVALTVNTAAGEFSLSPLSNAVTIVVNHGLTVGPIIGLSSGITSLNAYVVFSGAGGSPVGRLAGTIPVASGATVATTFAAPPAGVNVGALPMLVVSDTGELLFPAAPITGSVSVQYQTSRYGDQQVTDALYEGLDMLWPEIWNYAPYDTASILPSPIQWEYSLPAAFQDLRTTLVEVEWRPPSAFIIFRRISGWRQVNDVANPLLVFEKPPPVGGQVRLTFVQPFSSLSQVPTIAQFLPIYYGVARLLADAEVMRSRADDLPALTGENAGSQFGGNTQTAAWYMQNMFAPALAKLSIGRPQRKQVMYRTAERLGLSNIWQPAA